MIAFVEGHPEYEAIEAFVARRTGAPALARAIVTRHDGTQVDHLNDAAALPSDPARAAVYAAVDYDETTRGDRTGARLAFRSFRGEAVVLDFAAATPTAAAFGGLTDPGGHAPDVLPILWREASAVGAPATTITIDGRPYAIPPFGDGLGVRAFHSAGFAVGIVASTTVALRTIDTPPALVAGACWRFVHGDDDLVYEIAEHRGDRLVIRTRSACAETIELGTHHDALALVSVRVPSASERAGALAIRFAPCAVDGARFAVDVDAHRDLVAGRLRAIDDGFVAIPESPAWGRSRPIRVALHSDGASRTLRTTVGDKWR